MISSLPFQARTGLGGPSSVAVELRNLQQITPIWIYINNRLSLQWLLNLDSLSPTRSSNPYTSTARGPACAQLTSIYEVPQAKKKPFEAQPCRSGSVPGRSLCWVAAV